MVDGSAADVPAVDDLEAAVPAAGGPAVGVPAAGGWMVFRWQAVSHIPCRTKSFHFS